MTTRAALLAGLFVVAAILATPRDAFAYSWMIKHGYSACATCHVDPSGGELLNGYGRAQGYALLAADYGKPREKAPEGPLWGALETPQALALGASYRHLTIVEPKDGSVSTFPMQLDAYGGVVTEHFVASASLGVAKVPQGSPHARAAQVTGAQGDQLNLISRSHWLGVQLSPEVMIRAGRLNPPFGLRIPEHTAWVREGSRTDRESDQHHGLSVLYSGASWRGEMMLALGNYQISPDRFRERGYIGFAEYFISDAFALGASSRLTTALADSLTLREAATTRQAHGAFTRWALARPLVLLAEADILKATGSGLGYVGFLQVDYEPVQGVHLMATGEVVDTGAPSGGPSAPGAGNALLGAWGSVDYYFLPQTSLRLDVLARQESPLSLLIQVHLYL